MTAAPPSVVIHGHFYQPPREDPWLDEVETEPSAAPFHDWNERIERECYRAVVAARRYAADGRIDGIDNTLESISFDVGPTLLEWLDERAPATYRAILDADAASAARTGGFGNAMAMPYHHVILPLASRRDKVTEVRWGIADFRRRFHREPVGMWLPETAVDDETLDVLAAEGIRFTVLAPHQVQGMPAGGFPGSYRTPGGRTIAVFTYDGAISNDVAFGGLLRNAEGWADRLLEPNGTEGTRALIAVATDGETYGHHHHFGEVALAWLLRELPRRGARIENFASFLARHPAVHEVTLVAPSSWSCPHGVERWRGDCGCRLAPERATQQRWRAPLRDGLSWLSSELGALFERQGAQCFADPWATRDAYGAVVASDPQTIDAWISQHATTLRARELLELERNALRMFTSCGWFFDDIAGIEALQVLRYAARAIELAGPESAARLESGLLEQLARAESNDPAAGDGRSLYRSAVKPRLAAPARVAAAYAALCAMGRSESPIPKGYAVRGGGDLTVIQARTRREFGYRAAVERPSAARIAVRVTAAGGETSTLAVADLPELQRVALIAALREETLARALTPDERAQLATGSADFPHIGARALTRAVAALEHDRSADAVATVIDLADLLALHGLSIPFDAQTALYRLGPAAPADVRARLGFTGGT